MKKVIAHSLLLLTFSLLMTATAGAAEVSQGKCLQYDQLNKTITIEEYDTQFSKENPYGKPTGIESVYDVSGAVIGITPEQGDILRLAYTQKEDDKVAIKVMNVSKQDLRKK